MKKLRITDDDVLHILAAATVALNTAQVAAKIVHARHADPATLTGSRPGTVRHDTYRRLRAMVEAGAVEALAAPAGAGHMRLWRLTGSAIPAPTDTPAAIRQHILAHVTATGHPMATVEIYDELRSWLPRASLYDRDGLGRGRTLEYCRELETGGHLVRVTGEARPSLILATLARPERAVFWATPTTATIWNTGHPTRTVTP